MMTCDVDQQRLDFIHGDLGVAVTTDSGQVAEQSQILILAVKPNIIPLVLPNLQPFVNDEQLIISIAAGVTLQSLETGLPGMRVIRVMPNTPCLVGETAAGFALGQNADSEDGKTVERLLSAVGRSYQLDEKLLDAVTGLSGSGPAYVYMIIEALADGGVRMGLPRPIAQELAAQTVLGSAKMVLETGKHPGELKDMVASPGGTTIAGIHALEKGGLRAALINAVQAATERSQELSKS
jgi:pyrroline-5-carboxylate reductase